MYPLISIIVPVYNVKKYLKKCVESILAQTYPNIEIILVDDGSTDGSTQVCDKYSTHPNVNIIHKKNGGLSDARNTGIENMKGEYVAFVDGDDYIDENMYFIMFNEMKKRNCSISCCGMIREDEDGNISKIIRCPDSPREYDEKEATEEILLFRDIDVSVCNKLFHKSVFEYIRFPYGQTNEDAAVVFDILKANKIVHVGKAFYHYLYRGGSITAEYNPKLMECIYSNAIKNYDSVLDSYPDLSRSAEYYISYQLLTIVCSYLSQSKIHDKNYQVYNKAIKKMCPRIIFNKNHSLKNKILLLLVWTRGLNIFYLIRKKIRNLG